jgi:carbonic anhydrase
MRLTQSCLSFGFAMLVVGCRSTSAAPTPAPTPPASGAATAAVNARPAEWGYEGDHGPSKWSELTPAYAACKASSQSPLDLPPSGSPTTAAWTMNYKPSALKIAHHEHVTDILDNGHTIQVTVDEGSTLVTSHGTYQLKQFHFHTPSEHTVGGKSFPMEVHFVHQSAEGAFAVVSALFSEGPANDNLAKLIANFPEKKGDTRFLPEVRLELTAHLPHDKDAYYYSGSFTTPPCTENVEWLVFRKPLTATSEQLAVFAERLNHNNRPIQLVNERAVSEGAVTGSFSQK